MKAVILDGYTTNPGDLSWDWLSEFVDSYEVFDRTAPQDVDAWQTAFKAYAEATK